MPEGDDRPPRVSGHGASSIETGADSGRVRAACRCGWSTGWRRNRHGALLGLGGHLTKYRSTLLARARQIRYDHAHGLHDDHARPAGCVWYGCEDAARVIAEHSSK